MAAGRGRPHSRRGHVQKGVGGTQGAPSKFGKRGGRVTSPSAVSSWQGAQIGSGHGDDFDLPNLEQTSSRLNWNRRRVASLGTWSCGNTGEACLVLLEQQASAMTH